MQEGSGFEKKTRRRILKLNRVGRRRKDKKKKQSLNTQKRKSEIRERESTMLFLLE